MRYQCAVLAVAMLSCSSLVGQSSPFQQGREALAAKDYELAIACLTEAIRIDAKDPNCYAERGRAYRKMGEPDKCIADCEEALRLDPRCAEAYFNRGSAFGDKKDLVRSWSDLTEAIRLNPRHANAYLDRAYNYLDLADYGRALADLAEAIQIDPSTRKLTVCVGPFTSKLGSLQRPSAISPRLFG